MLFMCSLQHTVVPLLLCGKRETERGPSAAQKPHSEVGYALSCFFCRVSWKELEEGTCSTGSCPADSFLLFNKRQLSYPNRSLSVLSLWGEQKLIRVYAIGTFLVYRGGRNIWGKVHAYNEIGKAITAECTASYLFFNPTSPSSAWIPALFLSKCILEPLVRDIARDIQPYHFFWDDRPGFDPVSHEQGDIPWNLMGQKHLFHK